MSKEYYNYYRVNLKSHTFDYHHLHRWFFEMVFKKLNAGSFEKLSKEYVNSSSMKENTGISREIRSLK